MEYELLEDDGDIRLGVRRRAAKDAAMQAVLAELEAKRLQQIRTSERFDEAARNGAKAELPERRKLAKRARRRADKLIERVALAADEVKDIEAEAITTVLRELELQHLNLQGTLDALEDEAGEFVDETDRADYEDRLAQHKASMALVELSVELLRRARSQEEGVTLGADSPT